MTATVSQLTWTKDAKNGDYLTSGFVISKPNQDKKVFCLYECDSGHHITSNQLCKGTLKACKQTAQDLADQKAVDTRVEAALTLTEAAEKALEVYESHQGHDLEGADAAVSVIAERSGHTFAAIQEEIVRINGTEPDLSPAYLKSLVQAGVESSNYRSAWEPLSDFLLLGSVEVSVNPLQNRIEVQGKRHNIRDYAAKLPKGERRRLRKALFKSGHRVMAEYTVPVREPSDSSIRKMFDYQMDKQCR